MKTFAIPCAAAFALLLLQGNATQAAELNPRRNATDKFLVKVERVVGDCSMDNKPLDPIPPNHHSKFWMRFSNKKWHERGCQFYAIPIESVESGVNNVCFSNVLVEPFEMEGGRREGILQLVYGLEIVLLIPGDGSKDNSYHIQSQPICIPSPKQLEMTNRELVRAVKSEISKGDSVSYFAPNIALLLRQSLSISWAGASYKKIEIRNSKPLAVQIPNLSANVTTDIALTVKQDIIKYIYLKRGDGTKIMIYDCPRGEDISKEVTIFECNVQ